MRKFILAFLSFLPGVVFAQKDVGELIFRDILKMSVYPGSPFTGNIINDIVMFLIIPTIFLIVVITVLVLRLGLPSQKLAVLMGIGFYLYTIFGGLYSVFALLAGPYFLFLLIIIGILAFFLGHFGITRQGGPMHGRAVGGGMSGAAIAQAPQGEANLTVQLLRGALTYDGQMDILKTNLRTLESDYKDAKREHNDRLAQSLQQQVTYLKGLENYLKQQHRFNPTPSPVPV